MSITPVILYALLAAIFILSIALAAVVFYFGHIIKKQQINDILGNRNFSDARQKATEIIDEANNKALDILSKTNLSTDIASENFNQEIKRIASSQIKEFEKATADFMKLYAQILQDLKSKNIEVFQNVSKNIEINTLGEIESFKESMEKLTSSSEKLVRKKIDIDYVTVRKEIEDYREMELKKIDQEIYELLEKVSKLVLGKAVSLSEHEDLIQESLEKAKKEGVFSK